MNPEQVLERLRARLGEQAVAVEHCTQRRLFVVVAPDAVVPASRCMLEDLEARFQIASGVDTRDAIEVLYHWALDRAGCVVTVLTRLDREAPEVESIAPFCVAAEWIEREMWELLGIGFRNHPDLRHLLLADDWPEGKYPLRRDYQR